MKIACIATGWYPQSPGGLEKYSYGLCHRMTECGDDVDLFVTGTGDSWSERAKVITIADPSASLRKRALAARRSFELHYREPYDVVNLHFAMNALPLAGIVSKKTPRVFHFHGPWAAESIAEGGSRFAGAIKLKLEKLVYDRIDRFVTLSTAFKDALCESYGVPSERVDVVPMGIDTEFFVPAVDRSAVRRAGGWAEDRLNVFTARRLINRVGLVQLLDALARVPDHARRLHVKIAGRGPMEAELRRRIAKLGLQDTVEMLGFISERELVAAYQGADLTILPTQALEGFGTIISESLACGTPVAVTPVGGMPEALASFSPQLIARSPGAEDIAALLDAAASQRIVLPDRVAARRYAVEHYAWPNVYSRVRAVFEQAMRERN